MVAEMKKVNGETLASPYAWQAEHDPGASECSALGGIKGLPQDPLELTVETKTVSPKTRIHKRGSGENGERR